MGEGGGNQDLSGTFLPGLPSSSTEVSHQLGTALTISATRKHAGHLQATCRLQLALCWWRCLSNLAKGSRLLVTHCQLVSSDAFLVGWGSAQGHWNWGPLGQQVGFPAYQYAGVESSQTHSTEVPTTPTRSPCAAEDRQHSCGILHQQAGWSWIPSFLQTCA